MGGFDRHLFGVLMMAFGVAIYKKVEDVSSAESGFDDSEEG